jgi:hypothetical protein
MEETTKPMAVESTSTVHAGQHPSFSRYRQNLNIEAWMKNFEVKCGEAQLSDQWKMLHIVDYVEDAVQEYYYDNLGQEKTWKEVKRKLIQRFRKFEESPLLKLQKVRQDVGEGVQDYFRRKIDLLYKAALKLDDRIGFLNDGVDQNIQPFLVGHSFTDEQAWLEKAIAVERSMRVPARRGHVASTSVTRDNRIKWPPSPCRICAVAGVPGQWHFHAQCPNRKDESSGRDPPTRQLPFASSPGLQGRRQPMALYLDPTETVPTLDSS